MSTVPPSPANPTTVTQVLGNAPDITAQQHAGTVMIAPGPTPFRTYRIARVAAHPGHPTWPDSMYSSAGIVRRAMSGPLLRPVQVGPRDLVPVPVARQQGVEHALDHGRREVPPPEAADEVAEEGLPRAARHAADDLEVRGPAVAATVAPAPHPAPVAAGPA